MLRLKQLSNRLDVLLTLIIFVYMFLLTLLMEAVGPGVSVEYKSPLISTSSQLFVYTSFSREDYWLPETPGVCFVLIHYLRFPWNAEQ